MGNGHKKVARTESELDEDKEFSFYVTMTYREREEVRKKMRILKSKIKIPMSTVIKKVLIEHLDDEEFLKYINLL